MTLIELMTVVAVLAIISSIGVASYRRYMLRSNRSDGMTVMLHVQAAEEKFFLQNNSYTTSFGTDGLAMAAGAGVATVPTQYGYYNVTIAAGATGNIATSYSVTATAVNGQVADTSCLTLSIDDQNTRASNPGPANTCWH
jgi:type IV pilus assembly protein PilE